MNLKLAEYKDGEFERFLELSKTECKIAYDSWDNPFIYSNGEGFLIGKDRIIVFSGADKKCYLKDSKDPLNRFNNLFDGRTYGEGNYVLVESKIIDRFGKKIVMSQDDVFKYNKYKQISVSFDNFHYWEETESQVETNKKFKILGNLHENPELWEKMK